MSEERRAAPVPLAGVEVAAVPSDLDGNGQAASPRPGPRDSSPARRRGRMTLRIPDDEVSRPQGDTADPPPVRAVANSASPPAISPGPSAAAREMAYDAVQDVAQDVSVVLPMRIISITSDLPPAPLDFDAGPTLTATQESWLPPAAALDETEAALEEEGEDVEVVAHLQMDAVPESLPPSQVVSAIPSAPRVAVAVPLALRAAAAVPSAPRLAAADEGDLEAVAESEEVRFEDDAPTPMLPRAEVLQASREARAPADGERRSDPGEAPEISAEDLVAVEAAPARAAVDLPPMRARMPSQPPLPPHAVKSIPVAPPLAPGRPPLVIVPPQLGNMGPQTESIGPRRKGRLWWEDLFNDDYVRTMEKLTDAQIAREVDFIETSLGLERGGAMLDLACGTGRQAIDLASRGYEVVAFDLSLAMLARAGDEAQERDVKLNFVQGDMREMAFEEQFDGVYSWNTSFGYFDEEKNANVVDRVRRALKKGGLFLLDVVNRDFILRQSPSLAWFEGDGCVCMDEMTVDFITSRMKVKRTLMLDDGRSREIEYSMRVYSLHELGKILHEHGFKVCEVTGRVATPGVYFGNESPRTIILAEKR
jgi:SAM-dependent methyltransferase